MYFFRFLSRGKFREIRENPGIYAEMSCVVLEGSFSRNKICSTPKRQKSFPSLLLLFFLFPLFHASLNLWAQKEKKKKTAWKFGKQAALAKVFPCGSKVPARREHFFWWSSILEMCKSVLKMWNQLPCVCTCNLILRTKYPCVGWEGFRKV